MGIETGFFLLLFGMLRSPSEEAQTLPEDEEPLGQSSLLPQATVRHVSEAIPDLPLTADHRNNHFESPDISAKLVQVRTIS